MDSITITFNEKTITLDRFLMLCRKEYRKKYVPVSLKDFHEKVFEDFYKRINNFSFETRLEYEIEYNFDFSSNAFALQNPILRLAAVLMNCHGVKFLEGKEQALGFKIIEGLYTMAGDFWEYRIPLIVRKQANTKQKDLIAFDKVRSYIREKLKDIDTKADKNYLGTPLSGYVRYSIPVAKQSTKKYYYSKEVIDEILENVFTFMKEVENNHG